jgi:hypothetical protein
VLYRAHDFTQTLNYILCTVAEVPQAMLEYALSDTTGPFAVALRRYLREVHVPAVRTITGLIEAHAAVVEFPPMDFFKERFPGEPNWDFYGPTIFVCKWMAYTHDWEGVLKLWDEGVHPASLRERGSLGVWRTHHARAHSLVTPRTPDRNR